MPGCEAKHYPIDALAGGSFRAPAKIFQIVRPEFFED